MLFLNWEILLIQLSLQKNQFNNINEENFVVVVDYNQIKENSRNCKLILRSQPSGVSNVRISPETVEFIIEQIEG